MAAFVRWASIIIAGWLLASAAGARPIEVRVVIVTAFERGADTGDAPGEYQAWAEVMPEVLPFPAGFRHLRYDPQRGALLIQTGMGTSRAGLSTLALGLDPRFDLRHAYWLVAAIAGVDPARASIGSAAWIGAVVDADYANAIDPREAPADWPVGLFPRDRARPYQAPRPDPQYNLFPLDAGLRNWAYALTKDVALSDTPALQAIRARYSQAAARTPPHVLTGTEISGQTFWHGAMLTAQYERWSDYWTGGGEPFVMTAMEDTGTAAAIAMLGRLGKSDPARLMILRTASNYSAPPPQTGAATSLAGESAALSGLTASLDAAFKVGSRIVDEIGGHWDRYRDHVPNAPAP